jgi:chemotaxis protein MotA
LAAALARLPQRRSGKGLPPSGEKLPTCPEKCRALRRSLPVRRKRRMNPSSLFDPASLLLVGGGTLLATLLRAGPRACAAALRESLGLLRRRLDGQRVRAALAGQINEVRADGLIRARLIETGDKVFDQALAAMLIQRSVCGLRARHEAHCRARLRMAREAVRTWTSAAELAPAFGLVGTLLSLSQLAAGGIETGGFNAAISGAVLTTLYGVLLANLLFLPLADAVERVAEHEHDEREALVDWLIGQIEPAEPQLHDIAQRAAA